MKKITLEKLIYKNYLKTSLTSIIFIELVLVIVYFTVNNTMMQRNVDFILSDIKNNTYELVNEKTELIDNKLSEIMALSKILQEEHQSFFENSHKYKVIKQPKFDFAENGMYYKFENNEGSSLVVSKETTITPLLKKELIETEIFDLTFKTLVNHDKNIVAAYYNSHNEYSRYYPFLEKFYDILPSDMKVNNYNFYYLANERFNSKKDVVLTDVYLDPAKQGWLLSVIVPIYNKDKLEGVSGLDITLNNFINSYLNIRLPHDGKSFIVNNYGKIIAMSSEIEDILKINEVDEYKYQINEKIDNTIYKSNKYSILEHPNKQVVNTLKNIIKDKEYSHKIQLDGVNYLIFTNKIQKTSWYTISLINEDEVLKEIRELECYYNRLGVLIISAIFIFYLLFFFFLRQKAREFVNQINVPLLKIIEQSKNIGKNKDVKEVNSCGISEIDKLSDNFNKLVLELDVRTNKFIEEETKRIYQEKLANTDPLTGAFNRRYLNEFTIEYLRIIKREKKDLSLLMIDLDDFKKINDSFGHETGDDVLKQLVLLSKTVIRENDLIIRLGGDEFLILLPNTSLESAKLVARKIVESIDNYNKKKEFSFTVSIGISEFNENDFSIGNMIMRADNCLYKAKKIGKDCIV